MNEKNRVKTNGTPSTGFDSRRAVHMLTLCLLLMAAAAVVVSAQPLASGVLGGFQDAGFEMVVQGRVLPDARVLQSQQAGAILILSSELESPVLIRLREQSVETVKLMKVSEKADGTVDLLPDATLDLLGRYQVNADRSGVTFVVAGGTPAEIREKAPLLGSQDVAGMKGYDPSYGRSAAAYTPSNPILERLGKATGDVEVVIFFGTWCPACKEMVPRMLRVAEELEGSEIDFDFYGLPRGISGDPRAKDVGIDSVPTGVVLIDGKEVGRIQGNSWKVPELALNNLLKSTIPSS